MLTISKSADSEDMTTIGNQLSILSRIFCYLKEHLNPKQVKTDKKLNRQQLELMSLRTGLADALRQLHQQVSSQAKTHVDRFTTSLRKQDFQAMANQLPHLQAFGSVLLGPFLTYTSAAHELTSAEALAQSPDGGLASLGPLLKHWFSTQGHNDRQHGELHHFAQKMAASLQGLRSSILAGLAKKEFGAVSRLVATIQSRVKSR